MPIFGAKSRAMRGCASKLACGHRIGPAFCTILTVIFGEFATSQRADVGIGPYRMRHEFAVSHRAEPRFYQLHWVPEYWLLSYSTRLNSP